MERHLQTIFCDDIRHELGGKLSCIGVYSGRLIVPDFPVALPKLCVAVCALTSAERPFGDLVLRVLKDDEVLTEGRSMSGNCRQPSQFRQAKPLPRQIACSHCRHCSSFLLSISLRHACLKYRHRRTRANYTGLR